MTRSTYICRFRIDGTQKKTHEYIHMTNVVGAVQGSAEGFRYERSFPVMYVSGAGYYLSPYQHVCVLGLYNDGGSGAVLNVDRVEIRPINPPSQASPDFSIYRSASIIISGGEEITAAKLDSASPDLPVGVQVLTHASIESVADTPVRKFLIPFSTSYTPAGSPSRNAVMLACYRGVIGTTKGVGIGELWDAGVADSRVQKFTVKPGDTFSIVMNGEYHLSATADIYCLVATDSGDQYMITTDMSPTLPVNYSPLTIVNGSTAELRVLRIGVQEISNTEPPFWKINFIDGLDGGEDVEVEKLDSANSELPPRIVVRRNANILLPGAKRGSSAFGIPIRNILHSNVGVWNTNTGIVNDKFYNIGRHASFDGRLSLREGQGIALLQVNQSGVGLFEVYFQFTVASARDAQGGTVYVS